MVPEKTPLALVLEQAQAVLLAPLRFAHLRNLQAKEQTGKAGSTIVARAQQEGQPTSWPAEKIHGERSA